jgi:adenylosuccinate synthase
MSDDERQAWVVVDLGFGDAGKGSITDFLVRESRASLVVRFNGGAQAGHTVVDTDGRRHIFSQFGAGSFVPAVETLLGPDFLLHPGGMDVEARHLERIGVDDAWKRTFIDERVRVISPFQQAGGRLREVARAERAHGTCGLGVGECVDDSLRYPQDTLHARDLGDITRLRRALRAQRDRKREELRGLFLENCVAARQELRVFDDSTLIGRIVEQWRRGSTRMRVLAADETDDLLRQHGRTVFEGAQGVLLDQDFGFHPHTTWSDCTPRPALRLLEGLDARVHRIGVSRTYATRHGRGPLPTESPSLTEQLPEVDGDDSSQGRFRVGALDGVLLRYACAIVGGLDGIALTCLDRTASVVHVCEEYSGAQGETIARIEAPLATDFLGREQLTERLRRSHARTTTTDDVVAWVENITGVPVIVESWGERAADKRWRR